MSTTSRPGPAARCCSALLLAASLAAILACVPAEPVGAASASCRGKAPTKLKFHRKVRAKTGTLSWRAPRSRPPGTRFRVYRGRHVVGQTVGRSIAVPVRPGRRYVLSVRVVEPSGRLTRCGTRLRKKVRFHPPSRPSGLAVTNVKAGRARLVWSPSRPGDGRLGGYRVYRDERVHGQVRRRSVRLRVASGRTYSFKVAGADTRGNVGPRSRAVRLTPGHHPPGRPSGLRDTTGTDTEVRLSWSASRRGSGRIAGYRIFRNRVLVRQVRGPDGSARNLAAGTRYTFTVAAIDTQGYMSATTPPVSVTTAMPPPTRGSVHAFLLASTDESFRDLQRHYQKIGTVYPTYFDCRRSDGAITGKDDPLITRWARLRRIQVLPRFNCQRPTTLHLILTNPAVRAATISRLVGLVRQHGYEGINVDFESGAATDRDALSAFVSALSAQLHAIGKRVSVEASAKYKHTTTGRSGFYDYAALGRSADRVFVMNWGWHWSTSAPGAPDDMTLTRRVADYVASMPNKARFVLGTHLYGMDWPNGGGPGNTATALEYADVRDLIARYRAKPVLDPVADAWAFAYTDAAGVHHEVWYPDAATIARRVRLARDRGLGVGFWRLGREDQRVWSDRQIAPGSSWP